MPLSFAPSLPYFPITFLERGVAVAFTTPMLAGTRVRPGERAGLELIVPNPSGARGQYILPWSALQDLCRPTLYDRRLQKAVALLRGVTPWEIRRITRDIAAEGLAGREARNAARDAVAREKEAALVTNFHLLLSLVQEVMPAADYTLALGRPEMVEQTAKLAVAKVAPQLGLDTGGVAEALEQLSVALASIGLGPSLAKARLPRAMARLALFQADMEQWIGDCSDESRDAAALIRSCAKLTLVCATETVAAARMLASRPMEMLLQWRDGPDAVAAKLTRPDWILDGWDTICAMWEVAKSQNGCRAAICELAHVVPVMPRQASEWVGQPDIGPDSSALFRRVVDLNHDWRSGAHVVPDAARGEHLLAMAG